MDNTEDKQKRESSTGERHKCCGNGGVMADYIAVRALKDGVSVVGLTRGTETKVLHTERLDKGELFISQFTELVSVIKVRGEAEVYTKYGMIPVDSKTDSTRSADSHS